MKEFLDETGLGVYKNVSDEKINKKIKNVKQELNNFGAYFDGAIRANADKIHELEQNQPKVIKASNEQQALQLSQQNPNNFYYWS